MWEYEFSTEVDASPEAIWRLWEEVAGWGRWITDIEWIEIDGPFAVDSKINVKGGGREPMHLRIAEVKQGERFVDEADHGEVAVRVAHEIEGLGGDRAKIRYQVQVSGPAADTEGVKIASGIAADFPPAAAELAALVKEERC